MNDPVGREKRMGDGTLAVRRNGDATGRRPIDAFRRWRRRSVVSLHLNVSSRGVILGVLAFVCMCTLLLPAQTLHYTKRPDVGDGRKVYNGGCLACHGSDGKGAPMASTVFLRPDTFPDFTDCAGTTPEPNGNWKAAIVHGGPSRGLSQIMPAFGDLLTDQEVNDAMA